MNEIILQFDNISYRELTKLQGVLGVNSADEVLARLVELGYEKLLETTTRPTPLNSGLVGSTSSSMMRGDLPQQEWVPIGGENTF